MLPWLVDSIYQNYTSQPFPSIFLSFRLLNFHLFFRMGEITIELYWKHAPNTCRNFAELARRGYYNNTVFHRVIQDFMIQGGDPSTSKLIKT